SPGDVFMSVWEIVELARHPDRPYSLDYIRRLAPDFIELHGDRLAADDPALVGGIGTWHGRTTVFLGHQKGRTLKDRVARNWGTGGGLGSGVAHRVILLVKSIYSVASPEAAASIVWRDNTRKVEAAEQLQLTSREIVAMGVVEEVVPEPPGSASTDYEAAARSL